VTSTGQVIWPITSEDSAWDIDALADDRGALAREDRADDADAP
jgi:hypothetical protein